MLKKIRQQTILEIISRQPVPNQTVLRDELEKRNHKVTQATVSRDLTELNLVKDRQGYLNPRDESDKKEGQRLFLSPYHILGCFVEDMSVAKNLIVIRTVPGSAQQVGVVLEGSDFREVLGTVAGNSTLLVVTKSQDIAQRTRAKITKMMM